MIGEPGQTQYDLKFNLFGFPVRVHPGFFLISVLFGQGAISLGNDLGLNAGVSLLVIIVVFFLSILIHELGHTFAFRLYGVSSSVCLYWMGGLAIPSNFNRRSLTSNQQIVVSLAGPIFGLLFGGVLVGIVYAVGGSVEFHPPNLTGERKNLFPALLPNFLAVPEFVRRYPPLVIFLSSGLYINIFWNVMNLVPVYPLDGGQIAREIYLQFNSRNGIQNSLMLSLFAGAGIAILALMSQDTFIALLFGYLAYMSYMSLQRMNGQRW